uniref:ZP domain-containing protein n=1 Tax=Wuchereria bancrofti TaxID=6293 RepID=A0AAF5RUW4_WUCBA
MKSKNDQYISLVNNEVRVQIDNHLTVYDGHNLSNSADNCTFTFQYKLVENCWVGSKYHLVYLITADGCSSEIIMISTPRHDSKMQKALSLGWLTVRQGFTYLRLKCHIQICHVCDDECTLLTSPINYTDYSNSYNQYRHKRYLSSNDFFFLAS